MCTTLRERVCMCVYIFLCRVRVRARLCVSIPTQHPLLSFQLFTLVLTFLLIKKKKNTFRTIYTDSTFTLLSFYRRSLLISLSHTPPNQTNVPTDSLGFSREPAHSHLTHTHALLCMCVPINLRFFFFAYLRVYTHLTRPSPRSSKYVKFKNKIFTRSDHVISHCEN